MTNNSNVIIGTWPLSGDFGTIDEFKAEELINYSISKGFTEFDTAPNYGCGKIEEILSKTIKNYQTKFKINTKCGNSRSGEKSFDTDDIKNSIDTSIDKFGTINTIFLHNPRDEVSSWTKLLRIINHYKEKNFVNALQWLIGLEIFLLVKDPSRVFFTTDHPNGAPFTSYPELFRLLMDYEFRLQKIDSINKDSLDISYLKDLKRTYSIYEIAIMTRASPAKILGLEDRGSLKEGCIAAVSYTHLTLPTILLV